MPENTTHESPAYEKRGYLNHEFRLFHLRGQMDTPVAYHYHDFHKVLILLNGGVSERISRSTTTAYRPSFPPKCS